MTDRQNEKIASISREQAAEKLECYISDLQYYAWPETFSSTCGPWPGMGGQAFCTFTIEAWTTEEKTYFFCNGKFIRTAKKFIIGDYYGSIGA